MKQFLMLIRENAEYGALTAEEMQTDIEKHIAWVESLVDKGNFESGNPLEANGATIKGGIVTDGPFVETKECVSGYYFLLATSLEEAVNIAKTCPAVEAGATIEVREVINTDDVPNE